MSKLILGHFPENKAIAEQLEEFLKEYEIELEIEEFDVLTESIAYVISYTVNFLEANDFFVVIIPNNPAISYQLVRELSIVEEQQLKKRNISLLLIVLSPFSSELTSSLAESGIQKIELSNELGSEKLRDEISEIAESLKSYIRVDFDKLNYSEFTNLIIDLLKELEFKEIGISSIRDAGYDIHAKTVNEDPFGNISEINWLFQLKFYKRSRVSVHTIRHLTNVVFDLPGTYRGVLITNAQLTSIALRSLRDNKLAQRIITIIDGVQLKNLLLRFENLIEKYFGLG